MPLLQTKKTKIFAAVVALLAIASMIVGGSVQNLLGQTDIKFTGSSKQSVEIDSSKITEKTSEILVSSPDKTVASDKVIAGKETLVARYKITAKNEDFKITKLTIENDSDGTNAYENDYLVSSLKLKYPKSLTTPATLDGSASFSYLTDGKATFTGLSAMVPSSTPIHVEVYATTSLDIPNSKSGGQLEIDFKANGPFEAIGVKSGLVVTENSSNYSTKADVDAPSLAFYKTLVSFSQNTSSTSPCGNGPLVQGDEVPVYCFKVSADPAGGIGWYKLSFGYTPTLLQMGSADGQLAEPGGFKLYKYDSSGVQIGAYPIASGTGSGSGVTLTVANEELINAGASNYYVLKAPISFEDNSSASKLSTRLILDSSVLEGNTFASEVNGKFSWSDRSANGHSFSTPDWTNAHLLKTLSTPYLELAEQ